MEMTESGLAGASAPMTLLKIVGGHDQGGVRSCELAFTAQLRELGYRVFGVILGNGMTTSTYQKAFDDSVVVESSLRSVGAGKVRRVTDVARNEWSSGGVARRACLQVGAHLGGHGLLGVAVRRAYFLKVAGLVGRALRLPVFWHMCDSVNDPMGRVYYHSLLRRYGIHPVGNSLYTIRTLLGADADGPYVYPGFSPDRIRIDERSSGCREQLGIPQGAPVFGMVSRLTADKATDLVLEAFLGSEAFRQGAYLLIAGGPTDSEFGRAVAARASASGLGRVHLVGELSNVSPVYAAMDVQINGRRNAEPFGISIVEGMAAGKPVLAYRKGGPEETIVDGVTGWLTEQPTADAYRQALDRAWKMRAEWADMGLRARSAAQRFSTQNQVVKYLETVMAIHAQHRAAINSA
jgi:glycosyltransferase involved in cell wall biosynthesis